MKQNSVFLKRSDGFSLIELLIVVAIILIIAAIAIPNLLRARMSANEASAVGSLRTINTAEVTFSSTYGIGFGPLGEGFVRFSLIENPQRTRQATSSIKKMLKSA